MSGLTVGEGAWAALVLALALTCLCLLVLRRLRAAVAAVDAAWKELESVLVHHHAAAEELVRVTDAHELLAERRRELIEHAVADAARTGDPEDRAQRETRLHTVVTALDRALAAEAQAVPAQVQCAQRAYSRAWDETGAAGARYDRLARGYNRMLRWPLVVLAARLLGRVHAERFRPGPFDEDDR